MAFSRHIPDGKTAATTTVTKKKSEVPTPPPNCCVTCLVRLIRKLKRKGKLLLATTARRQGRSLQCRYDPMSYSLNFDEGACGSLPGDEDYYFRFYAFSSRYVTNTIKKKPSLPRESFSTASHEF
ncbi:PREDICTED: uncharacterized protein LOC104731545 [Camelina sativa]|uniref:Uncharacterized protein LOC104731545 n=1 Tax=Camelina sativa TaxID=90675 RepID=A0ABM0V154_CAMSA|nr:PREDICTED: uncharacterized protein LOC104731545 [Camelina sativa]